MLHLEPQLQHYDWGSHTVLAELTGRPAPTALPEAELWFGAHEAAPSRVGDSTLAEVIAANPERLLGDSAAERFGGRLPFLLKVLAPQRCLSIQCHPSAGQALDAPPGTYTDAWPKPEAFIAVTDFEVFAGMKRFEDTAAQLRALDIAALSAIVDAAQDDAEPARALLRGVLSVPDDVRKKLSDSVIDACRRVVAPASDVQAVLRVAEQFPGDIGLVVLLAMQHRVFAPGEYAFVPAGVLHAYVHGTAVEILANSDNIVRAGLTPKTINIPELLRIVEPHAPLGLTAPDDSSGFLSYPSNAEHFQLYSATAAQDSVTLPGVGKARIVVALHAPVEVAVGAERLVLQSGEGVFVGADEGAVQITGDGTAYLATSN